LRRALYIGVKFQGKYMRNLIVIIFLLIVAGCASVPANYGKPLTGSKVGIVLLIDQTPSHQHVGTTIFQNSNSNGVSKKNFHKKFELKISELLAEGGHIVVPISASSLLIENREDLFSYASSNIHFKQENKLELQKLAQENSLDYVILVYPTPGPAWPNSSAYLSGYGLYTKCSFGTCSAYALDYIDARIYDVKNDSSLKPMNSRFFTQEEMPSIAVPDKPESIADSEINVAAEKALWNFMKLFKDMVSTSEFI